jgi:biotin-[acetyl-CoA-carboxylase] ligase BirA-like protein
LASTGDPGSRPQEGFAAFVCELEERRATARSPENWVVQASVPSTNGLARRIVADYGLDGLDVVPAWFLALEQTAGRGRGENRWASPSGAGVYASRILTAGSAGELETLPLLVGIGLCRALVPLLSSPCGLKWPNDLMVAVSGAAESGAKAWKKIGGILIEAVIRPDEPPIAVLGFGVNHGNQGDGQSLLPDTATALADHAREPVSLAELAVRLIGGVEEELAHLGDADYAVRSYRELSVHRPGDRLSCRVGGERIEGDFLGFDERGWLRLSSGGKEITLGAVEGIEG